MKEYYNRHIDKYLNEWKGDDNRKPLLLRGARQVGKSSSIRNLGKTFKYFIEINIEKQENIRQLFNGNIDVKLICNQISAIFNCPIIAGETLLFIDEIQEDKRVISSLRYFYEDYPELHVAAAGSLLEFALKELPSFAVGRIRSLYMFPFSFDEFLSAQGLDIQVNFKLQSNTKTPLPQALHEEMIRQLRTFYLVGGMPEAVRAWIKTNNYAKCAVVHNDILDTYQDDFSKYKSRFPQLILMNTFKSVALQAGNKFVYSDVESNIRSVKEALELLTLAGLIIPVTHTSANGLPLGAESNLKYRKFLFLDIGLMQSLLGLKAADILLSDDIDFVNKGGVSEVFAGLELLKYSNYFKKPEMYYWQRMERNAQAEVDYLISKEGAIYPIEVKASKSGSMQSLYKFLSLKRCKHAYRLSLENFSELRLEMETVIAIYPLYAIKNIL